MKISLITPSKKTDALAPVIIEGLYDLGIEIIASDPGNGVRPQDVKNDEDFISHAKDSDFIFVLWGKGPDSRWPRSGTSRDPKYYLLDLINEPEKTAYIDGSEWTSTGHPETYEIIPFPPLPKMNLPRQIVEAKSDPLRCRGEPWINKEMFEKCRWYFKRECYPQDLESGIIPLNIACQKKFFGEIDIPKEIDIVCSFGQVYTGLRIEVQNICEKLQLEGFKVKFIKGLGHQDYLRELSSSHISVSAWGAGNSCMRMWESMANKTCCFAQKTEILFPNKPLDGRHYVEYSTPEEFELKIRKYLQNKEDCIQVGKNGYNFVKNNHVGTSRIKYILDIINS